MKPTLYQIVASAASLVVAASLGGCGGGSDAAPGLPGLQGVQGVPGASGTQGAQGPQGAQGVSGANGTNGATGATGQPGAPGAPGANGADGADGINGNPGAPGTDGKNGANGTNGANGQPGADGAPGADGSSLQIGNADGTIYASNTRIVYGSRLPLRAVVTKLSGGITFTATALDGAPTGGIIADTNTADLQAEFVAPAVDATPNVGAYRIRAASTANPARYTDLIIIATQPGSLRGSID